MDNTASPAVKLNGYVAFFEGKRIEIKAPTIFDAQQQAVKLLNVSHRKFGYLTVALAEIDGRPIADIASF